MVVEKLLRVRERESKRSPYLAARQFALGKSLQDESLKKLTGASRLIQVELLGELVGNLDSDDHA